MADLFSMNGMMNFPFANVISQHYDVEEGSDIVFPGVCDWTSVKVKEETAERPPVTYSEMIEYALKEKGNLTVKEIYAWIAEHFEYYRNLDEEKWQPSVRHTLTISRRFEKTGEKKGGHRWTLVNSGIPQKPKNHWKKRKLAEYKKDTTPKKRHKSTGSEDVCVSDDASASDDGPDFKQTLTDEMISNIDDIQNFTPIKLEDDPFLLDTINQNQLNVSSNSNMVLQDANIAVEGGLTSPSFAGDILHTWPLQAEPMMSSPRLGYSGLRMSPSFNSGIHQMDYLSQADVCDYNAWGVSMPQLTAAGSTSVINSANIPQNYRSWFPPTSLQDNYLSFQGPTDNPFLQNNYFPPNVTILPDDMHNKAANHDRMSVYDAFEMSHYSPIVDSAHRLGILAYDLHIAKFTNERQHATGIQQSQLNQHSRHAQIIQDFQFQSKDTQHLSMQLPLQGQDSKMQHYLKQHSQESNQPNFSSMQHNIKLDLNFLQSQSQETHHSNLHVRSDQKAGSALQTADLNKSSPQSNQQRTYPCTEKPQDCQDSCIKVGVTLDMSLEQNQCQGNANRIMPEVVSTTQMAESGGQGLSGYGPWEALVDAAVGSSNVDQKQCKLTKNSFETTLGAPASNTLDSEKETYPNKNPEAPKQSGDNDTDAVITQLFKMIFGQFCDDSKTPNSSCTQSDTSNKISDNSIKSPQSPKVLSNSQANIKQDSKILKINYNVLGSLEPLTRNDRPECQTNKSGMPAQVNRHLTTYQVVTVPFITPSSTTINDVKQRPRSFSDPQHHNSHQKQVSKPALMPVTAKHDSGNRLTENKKVSITGSSFVPVPETKDTKIKTNFNQNGPFTYCRIVPPRTPIDRQCPIMPNNSKPMKKATASNLQMGSGTTVSGHIDLSNATFDQLLSCNATHTVQMQNVHKPKEMKYLHPKMNGKRSQQAKEHQLPRKTSLRILTPKSLNLQMKQTMDAGETPGHIVPVTQKKVIPQKQNKTSVIGKYPVTNSLLLSGNQRKTLPVTTEQTLAKQSLIAVLMPGQSTVPVLPSQSAVDSLPTTRASLLPSQPAVDSLPTTRASCLLSQPAVDSRPTTRPSLLPVQLAVDSLPKTRAPLPQKETILAPVNQNIQTAVKTPANFMVKATNPPTAITTTNNWLQVTTSQTVSLPSIRQFLLPASAIQQLSPKYEITVQSASAVNQKFLSPIIAESTLTGAEKPHLPLLSLSPAKAVQQTGDISHNVFMPSLTLGKAVQATGANLTQAKAVQATGAMNPNLSIVSLTQAKAVQATGATNPKLSIASQNQAKVGQPTGAMKPNISMSSLTPAQAVRPTGAMNPNISMLSPTPGQAAQPTVMQSATESAGSQMEVAASDNPLMLLATQACDNKAVELNTEANKAQELPQVRMEAKHKLPGVIPMPTCKAITQPKASSFS